MPVALCHHHAMFEEQAPRRVLIVSLRFLGDALISSMMADGIKRQWPQCQVNFLVFEGMQGVLQGNGCVDLVLTIAPGSKMLGRLRLLWRLWRQYDLALTTQSGDFPHQVLWAAGRQRIGALPENPQHAWWKKRSAPLSVAELPHEHIANRCARVMRQAGVAVVALQMRVPQDEAVTTLPPLARPYAVLNPCARWTYKRWHSAGWLALVAHLHSRGLQVVVTGGDSAFETGYLNDLFKNNPEVLRLDRQLNFAQSAQVLTGAALYVGPDTFTTHLAAACGIPTLALFGPTDPRIWGPMRVMSMHDQSPDQGYVAAQSLQKKDNIYLTQNTSHACVPCQQEGCHKHPNSASRCLDEMPAAQVIRTVDEILAFSRLK